MAARTTGNYLDLMRHALGKTPDSRHSLIQTLNDAGHALVASHMWSWRVAPPTIIPILADQTFVTLPEDFGQAVDLSIDNSQTLRIVQTSIQDIQRRRSWGQFDALVLFITFDTADAVVTDDENLRHRRAEIYPAQSADRADVTLVYRRGWVDLDENDTGRVPAIPRNFERALVLFARSFAVDIENQIDPYENMALFGANGEIERLKREDAGRQVDYGRPLHDVLARGRGVRYPHRRITRA